MPQHYSDPRRESAERYVNRIRNKAKRAYAEAHLAHVLTGRTDEVDRALYSGLSFMAAQAVRHRIAEALANAREGMGDDDN